MDQIFIRTTVVRGCGKRKKGKIYLESGPSRDGVLPLWTDIDPPVPCQERQFRKYILVDREALLAGDLSYLVGASAERKAHDSAQGPEIGMYGMPVGDRKNCGICRDTGLEALSRVAPLDIRALGRSLRALGREVTGSRLLQLERAWKHLKAGEYSRTLARLWELYRSAPPGEKKAIGLWVQQAMIHLNAREDAEEVKW